MFLIRHAQASFLEGNYDKLSTIGEIQAHRLGEFWASRQMVLDRVYSGPRVRQLNTASIGRSWTFPSCLKQESRGTSCDLQLRRTDWSGHAARFESFATRHPPRGLDVSKLFLQRVPVLRRSFYAEHI